MPYFTTAELRALPDMADTGRFPDARLVAAHDWIAAKIRRLADTSFVAETVSETLAGGSSALLLSDYVLSVDSVEVDGAALSAGELAALDLQDSVLYAAYGQSWAAPSSSRRNIVVTYQAGYSATPPADLKEAAMRAARYWLLTSDAWSSTDERATSITNDFGNINLATAGDNRPTGIPDVDEVLMGWARRVRVPRVS